MAEEQLGIYGLVVEDEPLVSDLLRRILLQSGIKVDTADATEEGLRLLEENKYDLLLTDLNHEPLGTELYGKAKDKGMLAYIMTGETSGPLLEDAKMIAGKDLILKPFDTNNLIERIKADYEALPGPQS